MFAVAADSDAVKRVLVVAGEASGDQAAAPVVSALLSRRPSWQVRAVGGPKLAAAGAEIVLPYEEVAVMGFAEILARLPALLRHERSLRRRLAGGEVDLFLPVDFPGLNLRLAKRASGAGLPVLYYIAPQVWAWDKKRVETLRRYTDRLAVILPFEESWFAAESVNASYVGHPIMESAPEFSAGGPQPRLGLLPGSRAQEVRHHLPIMLACAKALAAIRPGLRFSLLESPGLPPEFYDEQLGACGIEVERMRGDAASFYSGLGAACVASGTATLETAIAGIPMAVIYRSSGLTHWLARKLVKLEHFALANLVAERGIVPEFLQDEASPERLVPLLAELLDGGARRDEQRGAFRELREKMGGPGCGDRVASLAIELLES